MGEYVEMETVELKDIHEAQKTISSLRWKYWNQEVLLSPQWLLLILVLIIFIIVWIKVVEKENIKNIILYGSLTLIITSFLDTLGGELQLWEYPYMVLPWGPRIICIDMMVAILFMLNYQYFKKWRAFLLSTTIMSFIFSFVLEPLTVFLHLYEPIVWKFIYSFPIYIFLAVSIKWIVEKIDSIEK